LKEGKSFGGERKRGFEEERSLKVPNKKIWSIMSGKRWGSRQDEKSLPVNDPTF